MSKLIMMKGLPASGKSTEAKTMAKEYGNFTRVNRDLLREMLHFGKWTGRNEGIVIDAEKNIVRKLLSKGQNVIVDDCNLSKHHKEMWSSIALEEGAKFETHEVEAPISELLDRDLHRKNKVGHSVIVGMAMQYGIFPQPEKGFVIVDIDGTLANIDHRLHYVKNEKKNWKDFFGAMTNDKPRNDVYLEHVHPLIEEGYNMIIVSGRPDTYQKETYEWLAHNFPYLWEKADTVFMRRGGDKRPDTEVKQDIYDRFFAKHYSVHKVIDDRPRVIKMWQENLLDVIDVGNGVDF